MVWIALHSENLNCKKKFQPQAPIEPGFRIAENALNMHGEVYARKNTTTLTAWGKHFVYHEEREENCLLLKETVELFIKGNCKIVSQMTPVMLVNHNIYITWCRPLGCRLNTFICITLFFTTMLFK